MTSDEAREEFSAAFDEALDPEAKQAFEAALSEDAELKQEYEEFCELLRGAHEPSEEAPPDLLGGVQKKLRERSKGRFYRDRFSQRGGIGWAPLWMGVVMLVVLGAAWFALSFTELAP